MSANPRARAPREIEADLERNRARMNDTLDWLEYKLSPGELFNQAWNYARDQGNGELTSNLRDTIARNPLPIALVGVGLAWLAISGRRGSAYTGDASYEEDWDTAMVADKSSGADHRGTHVTLGTRNGPEDKSLHRRT